MSLAPKLLRWAMLAGIAGLPWSASAATGMCADDHFAVSIITSDRGEILDLAVTIGESTLLRYPEANGQTIAPPGYQYKLVAKKQGRRDALQLDIAGKQGRLKLRGKSVTLACEWS